MKIRHLDSDSLEAYSLGRAAEHDTARVEEHLLICAACRSSLTIWDQYLRAMKAALQKPTIQVHRAGA